MGSTQTKYLVDDIPAQRLFHEASRDRILIDSIDATIYNGDGDERMLSSIRAHWPDAHIVYVEANRKALYEFLDSVPCKSASLIRGSMGVRYSSETEEHVYSDWRVLTWKDERIELALPIGFSTTCYCIGDNRDVVSEFAKVLQEHVEHPTGRSLRYAEGWDNAPEIDEELAKVSWDDVILDPATITGIRTAVDGFFASREMYESLGFAWKRGMLLIGPPGTGKTLVCKAIAASLPDLPFLYVRDLRERCKNEAIKRIFTRARNVAPCILALEDMDGFITSENRTVFLNELDGFNSNDGIFVIASSNHPDKIDEALLKRPSRFDRVFHIGLPEIAERRAFCLRVLHRSTIASRIAGSLDAERLADRLAAQTNGFTPAYLKEALLSAALEMVQNGICSFDERYSNAVMRHAGELNEHLKKMKDPKGLTVLDNGKGVGFRSNN